MILWIGIGIGLVLGANVGLFVALVCRGWQRDTKYEWLESQNAALHRTIVEMREQDLERTKDRVMASVKVQHVTGQPVYVQRITAVIVPESWTN